MLIHDSVSIAAQMSKSINDRIERAENVIVFNLKRNIRNQKVKNSDLCFLSKETLFKCTCLVGIKSTSVRPAKIEFANPHN